MNICLCYHNEYEHGVCYGTKEKEPCSCGGDPTKCDFYEEVREKYFNADKLIKENPKVIVTVTKSKDPYKAIIDIIKQVYRSNAYDDYLVTIVLDGILTTEPLYYIDKINTFIWENDWYEGQKNISILGFAKISDICINNYNRIILKDGVPNA